MGTIQLTSHDLHRRLRILAILQKHCLSLLERLVLFELTLKTRRFGIVLHVGSLELLRLFLEFLGEGFFSDERFLGVFNVFAELEHELYPRMGQVREQRSSPSLRDPCPASSG